MGRLKDKIAIITGGGNGIGEATCERFAEEGAKVAIFEVVEELGRATAERLKAAGADAMFVKVDVSEERDVAAGVASVLERWGGVDILVNDAAITGANKLAHEVAVEDWDRVFAVNVRGSFLCTKYAVRPMMAARRGSIVNFSSIYGLTGNDDIPPYHATKGAIIAMTKTDLADIYRGYIACLNRQDWPALGQFVHDEASRNGERLGLSGYRKMLENDFSEIPDLHFSIALLIADPPHIASRLQFDCTPKGNFLGLAVSGKRVRFAENVFYEFQRGKIWRVWSVIDKAAIEAQL